MTDLEMGLSVEPQGIIAIYTVQVNKKFERKYRDCIKRKGDKIGTQTCYDISM